MLDKKCIVIFYSKGLYDSAAIALEENMRNKYKDIHVVAIADDEVSPWKYSVLNRRSYIFCLRNMPFLNKSNYAVRQLVAFKNIKQSKKEYREFKRPTSGFGKWCYKISIKYRRVYNAMLRFDPEVVICTTPILLAKANKAKHQLCSINMSICALITDYQLDKRFINYKTDCYFLPNEGVKQALIKHNVDEDILSVVNAPMMAAIRVIHERSTILAKYGITDNRQNVLFIGGRYGHASIKETFMRLTDLAAEFNLIVLTGGSESLAKYCGYIATSKNVADSVYVVEKVEDMAEFYSICDYLICSPTAYVTYEAIYHNIKIILMKGNDSMEKLNSHYLTTNSLALQGNNAEEILASIDKYRYDADFASTIFTSQMAYSRISGESDLAELIYRLDCSLAIEKAEAADKRLLIMNGGNIVDGSGTKTDGAVASSLGGTSVGSSDAGSHASIKANK